METTKKKVTIEHKVDADDFTRTEVYVMVDGENVGGGLIGGEPEDAMELRDYDWIRPMIEALAVKLGAEVETVEVARA